MIIKPNELLPILGAIHAISGLGCSLEDLKESVEWWQALVENAIVPMDTPGPDDCDCFDIALHQSLCITPAGIALFHQDANAWRLGLHYYYCPKRCEQTGHVFDKKPRIHGRHVCIRDGCAAFVDTIHNFDDLSR